MPFDKTQPGGLFMLDGEYVDANGKPVGRKAQEQDALLPPSIIGAVNNNSSVRQVEAPAVEESSRASENREAQIAAIREQSAAIENGSAGESPTGAGTDQRLAALRAEEAQLVETQKREREMQKEEHHELADKAKDTTISELPDLIGGVNDVAALKAMRKADTRKGARDLYDDRIAAIESQQSEG